MMILTCFDIRAIMQLLLFFQNPFKTFNKGGKVMIRKTIV